MKAKVNWIITELSAGKLAAQGSIVPLNGEQTTLHQSSK